MSNSVNNRPLSYAVVKTILQHAAPNERIRWSQHLPALENIDKLVPFRCQQIKLDEPSATKIDGMDYQLRIMLKSKIKRRKPNRITYWNSRGGFTCDIDDRGRRIWSTEMAPGDIILDPRTENWERDAPMRGFTPYIEFRIDNRVVEQVEYNKTLIEAQRYMNTRLFGNRSHPIEVKHLTMGMYVFRLPEGVKFHVKELDMGSNTMATFNNLMPILTPNSLPLDYLEIYNINRESTDHHHPVVRSARTLYVHTSEENGLLDFFISLRNRTILTERSLFVANHIALIDDWILNPREVGSSITFEAVIYKDVEDIYERVMRRFEWRENDQQEMFISINPELELCIAAGDVESAKNSIKAGLESYYSFFRMKVVMATGA